MVRCRCVVAAVVDFVWGVGAADFVVIQQGTPACEASGCRVFSLCDTQVKKHPILSYRVLSVFLWWDVRGSNPRQTD